jgi:hypothetical protein
MFLKHFMHKCFKIANIFDKKYLQILTLTPIKAMLLFIPRYKCIRLFESCLSINRLYILGGLDLTTLMLASGEDSTKPAARADGGGGAKILIRVSL